MRHASSQGSNNSDLLDEASRAQTERMLLDANDVAVLRHKLTLLNIEAAHRLAWYHSHFNPDQPRVPAGRPDGGRWTGEGAGTRRVAALDQALAQNRLIMSDVAPDGIRVWTQYAEAKDRDAVQNKAAADAQARADAALIERTSAILHQVVLQVSGFVLRRPGSSPREYGVDVHFAFATAVRALNLPGIGKTGVEQSFDKEGEARYGKDGSIRTDVVLRNDKGNIIAIYDLKTGNAIIRPSRAAELRAKTGSGPDVPVIELHSERGIKYR
jgi:hypothetical protein